ncbi:PEP7 [Candida jiufengensis]|uniref:PEP7 n=1 Tax=Candida jiufengensis TaxID=497108 RepID=UPI002225B596|nr:PEP7 [Candida jiufengensis]KAI5955371.1 PEP7 [Candida jiufengensis]
MTEFRCPICNEQMINLSQLNQHIDDIHNQNQNATTNSNSHDNSNANTTKINDTSNNNNIGAKSSTVSTTKSRTTPTKKINKIAFTEQGFSIGDINSRDSSPEPNSTLSSTNSNSSNLNNNNSNEITRKHWKHAQSQSQLKCKICSIKLNVKNGIVNCRKCGDLYCNEHTHYQIKLRNPNPDDPKEKGPQDDSSSNGKWSRCCELCYRERMKTEVNMIDLTKEFKSKRQVQIDSNQLYRTKIQRNFIKLINLMVDKKLSKQQTKQNSSISQTTSNFLSMFNIDNDEKELVGNNWRNDSTITNCTICFTKFNFIIRKHHCRLCGNIVCDDSYGVRKHCSIYVPVLAFMEKLPNLNYSQKVKESWSEIDDELRFRCCVNCKNAILFDWKKTHGAHTANSEEVGEDLSVFTMYEGLFLQKQQIMKLMHKYENGTIKVDKLKDINNRQQEDNLKTGHKLMLHLKEFENSLLQFKNKFFYKKDNRIIVRDEFQLRYNKILMNIYQSVATFLQENIIKYREINDLQNALIQQTLESSSNKDSQDISKDSSPVPRLTKKQIRELREQLMVLNEQKFLVEKTIDEFTKNRKFDELNSLIDNKNEIVDTIKNLEMELGEFGF